MQLFKAIAMETVNLCTRRCWHCKYGQPRETKVQWLSDELIHKIADNLKELNFLGRFAPYGINEPLMDKRIPDIVRLFRSSCPEALLTLTSNGDLLTPEIFRDLLEAGLDGLGISIYDKKSFNKLKSYARHPKVRLLDMRYGFLENRGGNIKNGEFTPALDKPCTRPFISMVIKPNGDVALCCDDMYGDVVMGNVAEQRLEEIWNSEKFQMYRDRLGASNRKGLPLCETCSWPGGEAAWNFPLNVPPMSPLHLTLRYFSRKLKSTVKSNRIVYNLYLKHKEI